MTTPTTPETTASSTGATAVTTFRAKEAARLDAAATAQKDVVAAATADAVAAATALTTITAAGATLRQDESVLRQQLAAATTGPERHVIELALDVNRGEQIRTGLDEQDAKQAKIGADSAAVRAAAAAEQITGALQTARQLHEAAKADTDADAKRLADLATAHPQAVAEVRQLAGAVAEAVTRLGVLLGGDHMVARVNDAVREADATSTRLGHDAAAALAALAATRGAVAGAENALATARAAVEAAAAAPARVAAAALKVEAARVAVASPGQSRTNEAAKEVADGVTGAYERWLLTLTDDRITLIVELLDAVSELNRVQAGNPGLLRQRLIDADRDLAAALAAEEARRRAGAAAAVAAQVADAAVAAAPAPAERRRAAVLRGE
ncbi:hypothetical protein FXF51_20345 [Nonomuraea sp. PA05]|uniref:hypothetical protein n=1 Tax=Nonomuraea sp. PA05 TaxID=2604466 RepID=UPI0011D59BD3|nr:hypothetical protein [Nonomuraea sp. PA05]TYB64805.1 hypothetical protein FXF51_20345 [Nonomuraea sp. PA05]